LKGNYDGRAAHAGQESAGPVLGGMVLTCQALWAETDCSGESRSFAEERGGRGGAGAGGSGDF